MIGDILLAAVLVDSLEPLEQLSLGWSESLPCPLLSRTHEDSDHIEATFEILCYEF